MFTLFWLVRPYLELELPNIGKRKPHEWRRVWNICHLFIHLFYIDSKNVLGGRYYVSSSLRIVIGHRQIVLEYHDQYCNGKAQSTHPRWVIRSTWKVWLHRRENLLAAFELVLRNVWLSSGSMPCGLVCRAFEAEELHRERRMKQHNTFAVKFYNKTSLER